MQNESRFCSVPNSKRALVFTNVVGERYSYAYTRLSSPLQAGTEYVLEFWSATTNLSFRNLLSFGLSKDPPNWVEGCINGPFNFSSQQPVFDQVIASIDVTRSTLGGVFHRIRFIPLVSNLRYLTLTNYINERDFGVTRMIYVDGIKLIEEARSIDIHPELTKEVILHPQRGTQAPCEDQVNAEPIWRVKIVNPDRYDFVWTLNGNTSNTIEGPIAFFPDAPVTGTIRLRITNRLSGCYVELCDDYNLGPIPTQNECTAGLLSPRLGTQLADLFSNLSSTNNRITPQSTLVSGNFNGQIAFNCDLVVDRNLYFQNVNLNFAPGRRIVLAGNFTLTLDGCTLTCCNNAPWGGVVASNGQVNSINGTFIECALVGIQVNANGRLNCTGSILSRNVEHLAVVSSLVPAQIVTTGNRFQCPAPIPSYQASDPNYYTRAAIRVENCPGEIMIHGTQQNPNIFTEARVGIASMHSTVNVRYAHFLNHVTGFNNWLQANFSSIDTPPPEQSFSAATRLIPTATR